MKSISCAIIVLAGALIFGASAVANRFNEGQVLGGIVLLIGGLAWFISVIPGPRKDK